MKAITKELIIIFVFLIHFLDDIVVNRPNGDDEAVIIGQSVWGVLRGLESFTQLIYSIKENGYAVS